MKIDRLLSRKEVMELTGKSNVTLWRWYNAGIFPKPYRMGPNSVGFLESEILLWQEQLKVQNMQAANDED